MRKALMIASLLLIASMALPQEIAAPKIIYLIPGQGADARLFSDLDLAGYEPRILTFPVPHKDELLPAYARRMAGQIDTMQLFSLVGVSMGGMIAIEMSKFLDPEKIVIISSAKGRKELPLRYRFMSHVPVYKFPGVLLKKLANLARPLVEPESKRNTPLFRSMINDKDPLFMQRSLHMIVNWQNEIQPANLVHIHGTKDRTLPKRNIGNVIAIEGGGHMITLVRAKEISALLNEIFAQP